jgi:hypothetical protein
VLLTLYRLYYCTVLDFYTQFKRMPTLNDLKTVYTLPDKNDPKFEEKVNVLLWYYDNFLPKVVGFQHYNPTTRYYKKPHIKYEGMEGPTVPLEAEAFGLIAFENCISKWNHIVPAKHKNRHWKVPTLKKKDKDYKKNAKYHETKWSEQDSGQVVHGGWNPSVYTAYNQYLKDIKKFRNQDRVNKWKTHNLAFKLMRQKNKITTDSPTKKRKVRDDELVEPARKSPVEFVEEVSDEYSEYDDDDESSGELEDDADFFDVIDDGKKNGRTSRNSNKNGGRTSRNSNKDK